MARTQLVEPASSSGKVKELFSAVQAKLGRVPNMMKALGSSPAALEGYLVFSGALGGGSLDAKTREQIALITAEKNSCAYCLAAHSAIGKMVGLSESEIDGARHGKGSGRSGAAVALARELLENAGHVSEAGLAAARTAGLSDGDIIEVVANVSLNIFTNFVNHTADPEVDFPAAKPID